MSEGRAAGPRSKVFWARWGFFVVAAVLGALLVVSTLTSYLGSRDLLGTLRSGQRVSVERALRANTPRTGHRPTQADLAVAFEAAEPLGLRYLALLDIDANVIAEVGEALDPNADLRDGEYRVGDRVRFVGAVHMGLQARGGPPGPPPRDGGRLGPPPRPGDDGVQAHEDSRRGDRRRPQGHRPPKRPPPRFVMEVETSYARELELRSARDATIGIAVSVALILGAFIFGRLATRTERIAQELRNQRELASLGEMSAVLAHELRNPLASMKGNAELLAEGLQQDERRGPQARRVYEAAARLERLTEDLLDFVRAGKVNRETCAPKQLCRRAVEASGVTEVRIEDLTAPEHWNLDEDRMIQALVNLLRNAGQASGDAGPVELKVAYESGDLVFEVRDHGEGVTDEDRERIFEPFITKRTRGTGLGLAVVRRVAELHGGRVFVRSHPQGGAIFRLEIARA